MVINNVIAFRKAEKLFFTTDLTQKEIAKKVRVSQKTLCKWNSEFGWRDKKELRLKASLLTTKLLREYTRIQSRIDLEERMATDNERARMAEINEQISNLNNLK